MRVSFHLRVDKKDKKGLFPIAIRVTGKGLLFRRNISNIKIKEYQWDSKNKRCLCITGDVNDSLIIYNKILDDVELKIQELWKYVLINNIPLTEELIKSKLDNDLPKLNSSDLFFSEFDNFINSNRKTKVERTILNYITTKEYYRKFELDTGYIMSFDNINKEFFKQFKIYTLKTKGAKVTYLKKLLNVLNMVLEFSQFFEFYNLKSKPKDIAYKDFIPEGNLQIGEVKKILQRIQNGILKGTTQDLKNQTFIKELISKEISLIESF